MLRIGPVLSLRKKTAQRQSNLTPKSRKDDKKEEADARNLYQYLGSGSPATMLLENCPQLFDSSFGLLEPIKFYVM